MNEISRSGKFFAGVLLISSFIISITCLLAFWPDRLPEPAEKAYHYACKPFHMTLIDTSEYRLMNLNKHVPPEIISDSTNIKKDSSDTALTAKTKGPIKGDIDNTKKNMGTTIVKGGCTTSDLPVSFTTIHLNIILLLLVAIAGFLGALTHIASSFTNFVGSKNFERSWILWYFIKPFIGAAIAVIFYFVFRAGFLNGNENAGSVNIYGLIALSALAGLFTDKATLKLDEVFTVLFKPKDDRPDKMQDLIIQEVIPDVLQAQGINHIKLSGKLLTKKKIIIKIGDIPVSNIDITDNLIKFDYTVPENLRTQPKIKLSVTDESGKELFTKELSINP
ncbi:hypothetical protein GO495_17435 [Chitinophaga oryziterrae]|uniref:IPT/TIG domain-containing protein n=1 Tax=Chitinophaga oryziterrae TaxID=1031224 RepID=A0A6N8JDN0_9BACT|nr:hypothetical protein [Chitinophaga oryziterrae]MVT42379.1 hypothetical protein [Chitinophaga oryziterrae]